MAAKLVRWSLLASATLLIQVSISVPSALADFITHYAILYEGRAGRELLHDLGELPGRYRDRAFRADLPPHRNPRARLEVGGGQANAVALGLEQDVREDRQRLTPFDADSSQSLINGGLDFAAPNTGQDQMNGATGPSPITFGIAQVQTDLNLINALSATLGAEPGTNVAISVGNGATQTINASTGNLVNGGRVFTVTSFSMANGSTLNGSPTDQVNLNIGDVYFGREIDLSGGITQDHVLLNTWDGGITASRVPEPGMFGPLSTFATGLVSLGALVRTRRWLRRWK